MSAIKHALAKLDDVVERLEGSMDGLEESLAGEQRDMFASPSNQNTSAKKNGHGSIDGAILAKRLDSAIKKVETILKEG